ncbi:MAG: hypothetical protein HJJLKODD_02849 [Phycisphaerae bacterium]|nr:hypothetical protein [Phycisphaerae bacterium]
MAHDLTLPVAIVAVAGLMMMIHRRQPLAGLVLLILLSSGVGFTLLANFDLDRTSRFALKVFFMPLTMAMVIPLGYMLNECLLIVKRGNNISIKSAAVGTLILLLPGYEIYCNYKECDYSNYTYAEDHARNLLASLLPNAIIFPSGDHNTFPLIYLTLVENVRPDVTIADKYGFIDPAVLDEVISQRRDRVGAEFQSFTLHSESEKREFIIRHAKRPIYFTTKLANPIPDAALVPVGLLYHLLPAGYSLDQDSPWNQIHYRHRESTRPDALDLGGCHILGDFYFFHGLNELRTSHHAAALEDFQSSTRYLQGIKESFNNVGSALADAGLLEEAVSYLEHARQLDPLYLTPRWNLVRLYQQLRRQPDAEALLEELSTLVPDDLRLQSLSRQERGN